MADERLEQANEIVAQREELLRALLTTQNETRKNWDRVTAGKPLATRIKAMFGGAQLADDTVERPVTPESVAELAAVKSALQEAYENQARVKASIEAERIRQQNPGSNLTGDELYDHQRPWSEVFGKDPYLARVNDFVNNTKKSFEPHAETIQALAGEQPAETKETTVNTEEPTQQTAEQPAEQKPAVGDAIAVDKVISNALSKGQTVTVKAGDKETKITAGNNTVKTKTTAPSTSTKTKTAQTDVKQEPIPKSQTTFTANVKNGDTSLTTPGRRADVIPYYEGVKSGNVRVSPVDIRGDNGGLGHSAMNALYQPHDAQPSLGEMLAFASIMNGKNTLGGVNEITNMMQNADKATAYASQDAVAADVLKLLANGRSADEARAEATANYLLNNGQSRAGLGVLSEYGTAADKRAGRDMELAVTTGSPYTARSSFGYTPMGVRGLSYNSDGSGNIQTPYGTANNIPAEYLAASVYGALKGSGAGAEKVGTYLNQEAKDKLALAKAQMENDLAIMQLGLGINPTKGSKLTTQEFIERERVKAEIAVEKARQLQMMKDGNLTGMGAVFKGQTGL